ncbi:MAG: carbohydrate kinase family protein [Chloroflexi bacterium]|nr:carbohydrate kinase family protein [Chloroflexota bacterium]
MPAQHEAPDFTMDILITGSIAYDYLMRFPGRFREAIVLDALDRISLSFLVEDMTRHYGGVAANIAYGVALLGGRPRLMGTAGRDFDEYRQRLEQVGVDTSTVIELTDVFTATFFASTDLDNNQIANFYAGAMGRAGEYGIFDVTDRAPDLVVVSPNAPQAMTRLVDEAYEHNIPVFYDPSQQTPRMDGDTLRHGLMRSTYLAVNEYEWELIAQKTGLQMTEVLERGTTIFITRGKRGADIYHGAERVSIPAFEGVEIADPTGGGDAFRAGVLRGIQHSWPWEIVGQLGTLSATYAIEANGTQNHQFTLPDFVTRFRQHFADGGLLDSWLVTAKANETTDPGDHR